MSLKVRITKSKLNSYWYSDRIGETFEVEETIGDDYICAGSKMKGFAIVKEDCEIIKEMSLSKGILKIPSYSDKDNLVLALVNSGYTVSCEFIKGTYFGQDSYWLVTYGE